MEKMRQQESENANTHLLKTMSMKNAGSYTIKKAKLQTSFTVRI